MAQPRSTLMQQELGRSYLLLDVNCLFVAASLREEVWLYSRRNDLPVLSRVCDEAGKFGIRGVDPDRELVSFSGGEQAILACLMVLGMIQVHDLKSRKLLLCGVLESLSRQNRNRLKRRFARADQDHGVAVHCLREERIQPVALDPCES